MKVVIIGAGISGLALYLYLQKLGLTKTLDVKIYDSRDTSFDHDIQTPKADDFTASSLGGPLGLAPNGLKVLSHLDPALHTEVINAGHVVTSWRLSNARGWTLGNLKRRDEDGPSLIIGRDAFWRCLRRRVPDECIVSQKVSRVDVGGRLSMATLADGSEMQADLIVGADGIWSVVRRAIFEADAQYHHPTYEGLVGVGGFVPATHLREVPDGQLNMVLGRNGFFGYGYSDTSPSQLGKHGDKGIWWSTYSLKSCPTDWRTIDVEDIKDQLRSRHGEWKNSSVRNIVMDEKLDLKSALYPTFTVPLLPTWIAGNCVLVGDAAHALQPSSGQGASIALEDCEVLALLLQRKLKDRDGHPDDNGRQELDMALKQYCDLRMPRLPPVRKRAEQIGRMKQDMSVVEEMVMYFFIWLSTLLRLDAGYERELYSYDGREEVKKVL